MQEFFGYLQQYAWQVGYHAFLLISAFLALVMAAGGAGFTVLPIIANHNATDTPLTKSDAYFMPLVGAPIGMTGAWIFTYVMANDAKSTGIYSSFAQFAAATVVVTVVALVLVTLRLQGEKLYKKYQANKLPQEKPKGG
jgi:hypothetical protein